MPRHTQTSSDLNLPDTLAIRAELPLSLKTAQKKYLRIRVSRRGSQSHHSALFFHSLLARMFWALKDPKNEFQNPLIALDANFVRYLLDWTSKSIQFVIWTRSAIVRTLFLVLREMWPADLASSAGWADSVLKVGDGAAASGVRRQRVEISRNPHKFIWCLQFSVRNN